MATKKVKAESARRKYAPEQKARLVLEMISGKRTVAEIARTERIKDSVLYGWRNDVLEKHPGVIEAVQNAYARAKANAYRRRLGATLAPWGKEHWAGTFELFGHDPLPYGLTPENRRVVATLAAYLQRQGFIDAMPDVDRLFATGY